tara:strand:+ start:984 stop:1145 length:162 start_codon:yes stop_codon:yes gene_type:complete
MKLEITPEQEDAIYYKRMAEIVDQILNDDLGGMFETPEEKEEALKAFAIVRMI